MAKKDPQALGEQGQRNRRVGQLTISDKTRALLMETHIEVHQHSTTGEEIRLSCSCSIGRDHSYAQWIEDVGGNRYKSFGQGVVEGEIGA
jgi:hypothetical protein